MQPMMTCVIEMNNSPYSIIKTYQMDTLKYKVIKSEAQYDKYCKILHDLDFAPGKKTKNTEEEMNLLIVLIEKWDSEHHDFKQLNPIELLRSLMKEHHMKSKDLAELLGVNKSFASSILNYKKGLSPKIIRKLADRFKIAQEAFNRPYEIESKANRGHKDEKMMNTPKELQAA
jgi:HTH-type transcriptional regulator/antitoxin HigA